MALAESKIVQSFIILMIPMFNYYQSHACIVLCS